MVNSSHKEAIIVAEELAAHGVSRAVLSPGSRNAPLCQAISCRPEIETSVVVDERSAAFVALGMAVQTGLPVAMACTSGTAPLNYGPALAEAFYRHIPLIALTADRPARWIDCLDSQTIRQPGIFANFVKKTVDVDGGEGTSGQVRDAILTALTPPCGPVHINIRIDEPIGAVCEYEPSEIPVDAVEPPVTLPPDVSDIPADARIIVSLACNTPDAELTEALLRLSRCDNVLIVTDPASNAFLNETEAVTNPDLFFSLPQTDVPTHVLTIGGAPVSGVMKKYLRHVPGLKHIAVGQTGRPDTFGCLVRTADCDPAGLVQPLASRMEAAPFTTYRFDSLTRAARARELADDRIYRGGLTGLMAVRSVIEALDRDTVLHISNGMAVRYAQFAPYYNVSRCDVNRGVSGIDGCTSTAIGAAMATSGPVVLISGDMSALYDLGALAVRPMPANFRMAVISNGGGQIFRHIGATRDLPVTPRCLVTDMKLPLEALAGAFGFDYIGVSDAGSLPDAICGWISSPGPAILEIFTDGQADALSYNNLFKYVRENLDTDQGVHRHTV